MYQGCCIRVEEQGRYRESHGQDELRDVKDGRSEEV